jgi:hypothetical protein
MTAERVTEIVDRNTPQGRYNANQQKLCFCPGRSHVAERGCDGLPKEREVQQEADDPDLDEHNQIMVVHNSHLKFAVASRCQNY